MLKEAETEEVTTEAKLKKSKTASGTNRAIEAFLANAGQLEIDFNFGSRQLARYLEEIMLLESGVEFEDLGIKERRYACKPRFLEVSGGKLVNRFDLMYGEDKPPENSIALLQLRGVMRAESSLSTPGIDSLVNAMRVAYSEKNIMGIIVETATGGGESDAGMIFQSAVSEKNKPVVCFGHLVASAGYRALAGADEIIASSEGAEFGSIGTMLSIDQKFLNKVRKRYMDFYGEGSPGKNEEFRKAIAGDYSQLQNLVNEKTKSFQEQIIKLRGLEWRTDAQNTVSGKIFPAIEAKNRGLVDIIGNMNLAVARVRSLAKNYKY